MKYYFAGGVLGNNQWLWKEMAMKLFQAGGYSRPYVYTEWDKNMKYFLAGNHPGKHGSYAAETNNAPYILESYYYVRNLDKWFPQLLPRFKGFLLDSGAFTFISNAKKAVNWDTYIQQYAEYINKYDIENFFELDIDSVVGLKTMEAFRHKLETLTKKKCIPVWHRSLGKDYWLDMIKEYKYVGIGGIVSGEINSKTEAHFFPWFIETAKQQGTKVHALGYSNLTGVKKYPFYSVDSTAWLYGNRSGTIFFFDGNTLKKRTLPPGKRLRSRETAIHNFREFVKFANFLDTEVKK